MFFSHHDPGLPADWRYRRSTYLLDSGERPSARYNDDDWVVSELRFLRRLRRCDTDRQRCGLAEREPALYLAHAISAANPPAIRWAIEARLLAGESTEAIARKCATSPAAIEAYARVHFDVRDRLQAADHIVAVIIGPKVYHGMTEADVDIRWSLFAYLGGANVADYLIDDTCADPASALRFLQEEAEAQIRRLLAILAHTLPIDTGPQIAQFYRFMELAEAFRREHSDGDRHEAGTGPMTLPTIAELLAQAADVSVGECTGGVDAAASGIDNAYDRAPNSRVAAGIRLRQAVEVPYGVTLP